MRSTQLRAFFAVARAGGFSAASRELHVSQPTLTSQVRDLEEHYGVELFHRLGRGVQLTPTGRQLYAIAVQMAALESDALHLLKDEGGLRSGRLRVGAVSPYAAIDVVAEFTRRHPGVRVEASFGNSEEVLRDLREFRVDVAVLARLEDDPLLHGLALRRAPVLILLPVGHPLAARRRVRLADLHGLRMVMREPGSHTRRALEAALGAAGVVPQVVMELGSREAIQEAVAQGLGAGSVSQAAWLPDPRIRAVQLVDAQVWSETCVACLAARRSARAVAAFLEAASAVAAQPMRRPGPTASAVLRPAPRVGREPAAPRPLQQGPELPR
jgi:aminoethylphosphonate catabolism LysR family transcriptional regulator